MKIAFVYDAVYPHVTGGAERRVWEIATRLADEHDVHWYGLHCWDGPRVVERDGVTLHGVMPWDDLYTDGRRSIREALEFAARLAPHLLGADFDVVDCQQFPYFPCFTAKLASVGTETSLVVTWLEIWGDYWYDYLGRKGVAGKYVEKAVMRLPDYHLTGTDGNKQTLVDAGVNPDRVETGVLGGVDLTWIDGVEPHDEQTDLIFVGRLIEAKGVDTLVRAVERLRARNVDVTATVVGDGPERDALESLAERRGVADSVDFAGRVESDEEVIARMKSAALFVYPAAPEGGWSISVLEANACGVPAVSVASGELGRNEVVEDGVTGLLADARSHEEIASLVQSLLADDDRRAELGANARSFAESQSWDAIASRMDGIYESIGD
ncbi:glycosyltransferase family 4 protein [Halobaculum sp. P14]|uniref:glycosyltransferase family 4 protein n=1 Tax=Halobaculum sp. P14 TaxID=3421638 RepID=UPI003EBCDCF8